MKQKIAMEADMEYYGYKKVDTSVIDILSWQYFLQVIGGILCYQIIIEVKDLISSANVKYT
ncbi:hypothetical protein B1222_23235 [Paenibacillus larvae subsp. pulvifaciens]|nr:hypothetical protein B1222_23235 [Paenibacillus larvae subsp. pulvifaciens]